MFPVSFKTLITPDRSTVRYAARGHPLRSPLALCSMQRHMSTAEVRLQPASCAVCFISRSFQGPSFLATDHRGIGFYVAEILDPANFKGSYGSCEKDDNREPAAAAVAAACRLVSSSSAAAYILGAILKISFSCEHYVADNCFLNDSHLDAILESCREII